MAREKNVPFRHLVAAEAAWTKPWQTELAELGLTFQQVQKYEKGTNRNIAAS